MLNSVFRTGKNYYQLFLESKYVVKEQKIPKNIIDDKEISSDSDKKNCDRENSDEKNFDEENLKIPI